MDVNVHSALAAKKKKQMDEEKIVHYVQYSYYILCATDKLNLNKSTS